MKTIVVCAALLVLLGCKEEEIAMANEGIVGRWQVTEICLSTGAACQWKAASSTEAKIIELSANNTAKGDFLPPCITDATYTYQDGKLKFSYYSCKIGFPSFNISELRSTGFKASGIGCIEECSWRFKAIK